MKTLCRYKLRLLLIGSVAAFLVAGSSAQAKLVACVGSSTTYGYGLPDRQSNCYPAQLGRMLRVFDREWEVRNFGVNGTCVLKKGSLPYINQSAFNDARACNPDVVVIQLGTNDTLPSNWVYKNDFTRDFLELIDGFAQLPSHPKIYVWYPQPVIGSVFGHDNNVLRDEVIPLIGQLPTYRDVQVIDLYTPLEGLSYLYQSDGVHLTVAGTTLVAQIVAATIIGMRGTPDFNGDWKVDIEDLIILIEHWGQAEASFDIAPPPLGDGTVDAKDLEALMNYWGQELFDPRLIAHWKLDEASGTGAADSIGTNNGTLLGHPTWQPSGGKVKGALQFDGIDDCVKTPFVVDPAQGPFSVLVWVKGGAPGQVILSQDKGTNWLMASSPDGALMTDLKSSGRTGKSLTSTVVITDGAWHRLGLSWNGSNRILYVDDIEVAKDTQANLPSSTGGLYLGAGSTLAPGTFWSGLIDDVRIYNQAVKP